MKTIHSTIPSPTLSYRFSQPLCQIAFFDIETTGLSPRASSLYLIGAMYYDSSQGKWHMIQWFADDYHSEAAMLQNFFDFLTPFGVLYHFNGAQFDIPYLLAKCEKYGITPSEHVRQLFQNEFHHQCPLETDAFSIDILKEIRPFKKTFSLSHANQTFLETWLAIHRDDQYDGKRLIPVYTKYMQAKLLHPKDATPLLELLLLHNHDDMAGMLVVCSIFAFLDALHPDETPQVCHIDVEEQSVSVTFLLKQRVPKPLQLHHTFKETSDSPRLADAVLTLQDNFGCLSLPLYHGCLKYFFPACKDYYYFPEEDTAIHKSVAQFMDASYRKRATAATCYTKKEGSFFPSLSQKPNSGDIPLFYTGYRHKPAYYLLPVTDDVSFWSEHLLRELPSF
jgi:uncharacterized protein YprB with RNaseH-like and TPR domain